MDSKYMNKIDRQECCLKEVDSNSEIIQDEKVPLQIWHSGDVSALDLSVSCFTVYFKLFQSDKKANLNHFIIKCFHSKTGNLLRFQILYYLLDVF